MFVLFTDETNLPSDPNAKFFAYGGLVIPVAALPELNAKISGIRAAAGYKQGDELKFETNARPKYVSIEAAGKAKEQVVETCISLKCRFIVNVVLHAVAQNTSQHELIQWGANTVIGKFNALLHEDKSHGIVAVDRFASGAEYKLLSERFSKGLTFGGLGGESQLPLDRITLFTSTCMNASHASSAMDIVLGSFRYCINAPKNVPAAKVMMTNISKLIWCTRMGDNLHVLEKGLIFRPKEVKHPPYKAEYDALLGSINALLDDK